MFHLKNVHKPALSMENQFTVNFHSQMYLERVGVQ